MRRNLTASKFMLFLIIWVLATQIVFFAVVESLQYSRSLDVDALVASPWTLMGYQLAIFIVPLLIWLVFKQTPLKLPKWKLGGKNIVLLVALSFLLQPLMMLLSAISALFFHNYVSDTLQGFMRYPFWLTIVAIGVTPAICEELVFRGYIQGQHRDYPIRRAALLNGLFFAIIHLSMQQFAYAFVMGVIFTYLVHYTRSIWAGILPHFIVNATQATWGRLALMAEVAEDVPEPAMSEVIITLGVIVLVLMPVVVLLFRSFFRHNSWRPGAKEQNGRGAAIFPRYDDARVREDNVLVRDNDMHTHSDDAGPGRGDDAFWNESAAWPGSHSANAPVDGDDVPSMSGLPDDTVIPPVPGLPARERMRFDPYLIAVVAIFIIIQYLILAL